MVNFDLSGISYIDIHTHRPNFERNTLSLRSYMYDEVDTIKADEKIYSIGVHPWQIQDDIEALWQEVPEVYNDKQPIAIGEVGLDKVRNAEKFELQAMLFIKHIDFAQKKGLPIIVHCVKAFSELLHILKTENISVPMIVHGYQGNTQIAAQLLRHHVYLSFGTALSSKQLKIQEAFLYCPPDRVFFETDESNCSVSDVYKTAGRLSQKPLDFWTAQIKNNFFKIFGIK